MLIFHKMNPCKAALWKNNLALTNYNAHFLLFFQINIFIFPDLTAHYSFNLLLSGYKLWTASFSSAYVAFYFSFLGMVYVSLFLNFKSVFVSKIMQAIYLQGLFKKKAIPSLPVQPCSIPWSNYFHLSGTSRWLIIMCCTVWLYCYFRHYWLSGVEQENVTFSSFVTMPVSAHTS